jgi:hypothetical protein
MFAGDDAAAFPTFSGAHAAQKDHGMFQLVSPVFSSTKLYNESTTGKTLSATYSFIRVSGVGFVNAPQRQHTVYKASLESVNLMENQSFAALTVLNLFYCFCLIFTLSRPKTLQQSENSTTAPQ